MHSIEENALRSWRREIYKENQYYKAIIVLVAVSMIFLFLSYIMKWGKPGKLITLKPLIFFELLCLVAIALFYKMVIEIKEGILTISFGVGLIKKRLNMNDIRKDTIGIRKIPFYYGSGIRFTSFGTLYNTAPGQAVTFTTKKENKRFAVVTQDSSRLIELLKGY